MSTNSITFAELAGVVRVSTEDMVTYVKTWFQPEDKVCLVAREPQTVGKKATLSMTLEASKLVTLTHDELHGLIFDEEGTRRNLYFGVCPTKEDVSLYSRGTEKDMAYLPGVFADLDVKEGCFGSQEEIIEFLHSLVLPPTMIVGSGSGGIHAYWKLDWQEKGNKELIERWWAYLDEQAGDRHIDRLVDMTRILRVPGSVYFPKDGAKVGQVTLLEATGVTYSKERLIEVSGDAYRDMILSRRRTVSKDQEKRSEADAHIVAVMAADGNRWGAMMAVAFLEDHVNEHMTWDDILEPSGWTLIREQGDGSRVFRRPGEGAEDRSAVVDFEDSHVMSLFSESDYTNLADLKIAGVALTKYRVALRLLFEDDTKMMIDSLLPQIINSKK